MHWDFEFYEEFGWNALVSFIWSFLLSLAWYPQKNSFGPFLPEPSTVQETEISQPPTSDINNSQQSKIPEPNHLQHDILQQLQSQSNVHIKQKKQKKPKKSPVSNEVQESQGKRSRLDPVINSSSSSSKNGKTRSQTQILRKQQSALSDMSTTIAAENITKEADATIDDFDY